MSATDPVDRFNSASQAHHDTVARLLEALKGKDAEVAKAKEETAAAEADRDAALNKLSDYLEKTTADIAAAIGPTPGNAPLPGTVAAVAQPAQ